MSDSDTSEIVHWGDSDDGICLGLEPLRMESPLNLPVDAPPLKLCRFFNSRKGCRKDTSCLYHHAIMSCKFFTSSLGCCKGDACKFAHVEGTVDDSNVHTCPNSGCNHFCLRGSRQCGSCHRNMKRSSVAQNEHRRRDRTCRRERSRSPTSSRKRSQSRTSNPYQPSQKRRRL
jgi:hypothetical protein